MNDKYFAFLVSESFGEEIKVFKTFKAAYNYVKTQYKASNIAKGERFEIIQGCISDDEKEFIDLMSYLIKKNEHEYEWRDI